MTTPTIRSEPWTAADIARLTTAQRRVVDDVACGNVHPPAAERTLRLLVERGLLIRHDVVRHFHDGLPPMTVPEYEVPIGVHIAWAECCAEEVER